MKPFQTLFSKLTKRLRQLITHRLGLPGDIYGIAPEPLLMH